MKKNNKFLKSLAIGNKAEDNLIKFFLSKNIKSQRSDCKKNDILIENKKTVEVKFDVMSQTTSNIALEFFNCKTQKNSGILATTSDFWVFVLPCGQIWITPTLRLLEFFHANKGKRDVFGAGDDNANLRLYAKDDILNNCFTRIDILEEQELRSLIGE